MVYSKKKCRWNADKILSTRWKVIRRGGGYQHGGVESFEMVFEVRRGCKRGLKGLLTRSSSNDRKHRAKAIYLGCICIFKGWGMVGWPRGNPIWGGRNELDWGVWTLTRIDPSPCPMTPVTIDRVLQESSLLLSYQNWKITRPKWDKNFPEMFSPNLFLVKAFGFVLLTWQNCNGSHGSTGSGENCNESEGCRNHSGEQFDTTLRVHRR